MIIFLWKICTNCLPVRTELHKRITGISPLCHFCDDANEIVEHLFLLCPMAKAIWFGMELSIQMDDFNITILKDWLLEWLSKPNLLRPEAVWFYGFIGMNVSSREQRQIPLKSFSIRKFITNGSFKLFKKQTIPYPSPAKILKDRNRT